MKLNKRKAPSVLAVAMTLAGCELIGPQLHDKMPLPAPVPIGELPPVESVVDNSGLKSAKSEFFPSDDVSAIAAKETPLSGQKSSAKGEYSLNFDDADLGEVAKVILSDILGRNYTLSPQVTGKVTLQTTKPLSKDELIPTLEMLLSVNNAALVTQGDMYLIKPSNEAVYNSAVRTYGNSKLPNGYQTRIIPVRNVSAGEIADILKPLLPEKSQMQVEPNRNLLVVSGSASDLTRILDIISIFDVDVLKGRSFALFTMAHVDASNIVKELEEIFTHREGGGKSGGSFFRFIEIDRLNAILAITQNEKYLHDVESWILRLDKINTEAGGGVNVYRAQHVSAADLASTLNGIFGSGSGGRSRSTSIASGRKAASSSNKMGGSSGSSGFGGGSSSGGIGGGMSSSSGGLGDSSSSSSSSMGGGGGLSGGSSSSRSGSQSGGIMDGGGLSSSRSDSSLGGGSSASASGGGANNMGMDNVKIIADESNNALIIIASSEEYARIQKVIKQLDVLPMQVIIDATIVEVNLNDDLQYGIQWYLSHETGGKNLTSGGANNGLVATDPDVPAVGASFKDIATAIGTGGFSYAFSSRSGDINAILKAGAANNNINVISSPSLMVLNNQEASIKVGDSVPIRSSVSSNLSGNSNNGIVQTSSVQMLDTGVILSVKPRVNAGGLVMMEVMQSVNQATETKTSANIDSPTIQKREIETSVVVQSGETLVLGGLIKENNNYSRSGVPFLHELPLIGPLFGSTTRNKDKSELVVLITPRVINSRQDAASVTDEFRRKLSSIYDTTLPEPDKQ